RCVADILDASDPYSVPLPFDIPQPGVFVSAGADPQNRAAGELAVFAVGWALLHEVHHIQHGQDHASAPSTSTPETGQESRHDEELFCDRFATEFILEH